MRVRSLTAGEPNGLPEFVLVPGLGLGAPGYLIPWALAMAEWTRVTVLDVAGWRWGRPRGCSATLAGVATCTSRWLDANDRHSVVLVGHSTGAQAAVRTAVLTPDRLAGVVLAGPTFDPATRHWATLVRRGLVTLAWEVPAELPAVLSSYPHRGGWPLLRMLRDTLPDRLEDFLPQLDMPLLIMTG